MKTLSKKLKAAQNKLKKLEGKNKALDHLLKTKTKQLKEAEIKVESSVKMIQALSAKIGDKFALTQEELKISPSYKCRILEDGKIEFEKALEE